MIMSAYPLADLPWHVLVRSQPSARFADSTVMHNVDWLGLAAPITVLPSPASLRVLRRTLQPSRATRAWTGFGNPLLNGPDDRYVALSRLALERQRCSGPSTNTIESTSLSRSVRAQGNQTATRVRIIAQAPLPETADELCEVAAALKVQEDDIHLGAGASKAILKDINRTGKLSEYRMIHFATHAAKAGELAPGTEPGLILTPRGQADSDDGYLTASEIAELRLDADWVILSACNTASSGGDGATLSGLAQAFLFAGARALLVSHWYVDSEATVQLITSVFETLRTNSGIGRSEAMRQAMAKLARSGGRMAHPTFWAPFVVVGEGAADR